MSFHVLTDADRVTGHPRLPNTSQASDGNNGYFEIDSPFARGWKLFIIASDATHPRLPEAWRHWEHVSVHAWRWQPGLEFARTLQGEPPREVRIPTWREMCHVKALFWDEDDVVVQFHPAKADYVNFQQATLHLWRDKRGTLTPPPELVGPQNARVVNHPRVVESVRN